MTVDCLRADAVGCISGRTDLMPNINEFAKESLVFTKAFANGPGTNQSFPAILTSTYFLMHGGMRLLPNCATLAEVLRDNGFKTAAFHSNPFLSKGLGWGRGFSEFYDFMEIIKSPSAAVTRSDRLAGVFKIFEKTTGLLNNKRLRSALRRIYYRWGGFEIPYIEGRELNRHVIKWINKNKKSRFFLWMHYMDPHRPYIPPPNYLTDFATRKEAFMFDVSTDRKIGQGNVSKDELGKLKRLWEGEVKYTDHCIGILKEFLETEGILKDSLLILTGDHGEAFMEHNKLTHAYDIVYNEVIHVPLIIYGLTDYSEVVDDYVQLLDVSPTVLSATGNKKPEDFLGNSLIRTLKGNQKSRPIFSESAKPDLINLRYDTSEKVISCIIGEWKLVVNELFETTELFNLGKDFQERNNLVESESEIYKELMSLINEHLSQVKSAILRMKSRDKEKRRIKKRLKPL